MLADISRGTSRTLCLGVFGLCALLAVAAPRQAAAQAPWPFAGGDISNSHAGYSAAGPGQLSPSTAASLKVKWTFTSNYSISATPTVEPGGLYFPDWSGSLYKLNPDTGALIWTHKIGDYTGNPVGYSRNSPAISGANIIVGDRTAGRLMAINKTTGALVWSTVVDTHPYAAISSSPVIYNGVIYVGVASIEEGIAVTATYVPTFRGSVVALDAATGTLLWKFMTVPPGYTGGGVVGSNVVIAPSLGLLLFAANNNYSIPSAAATCLLAAGATFDAQYKCLDPTDYIDALVALKLPTTPNTQPTLAWARRFAGADTWVTGCILPGKPGCPVPEGGDVDFGAAPNLTALANFNGVPDDRAGTSGGLLLTAVEKSGMIWGINPANGGLFWSNHIPTASYQWGSASGNLWDHNYLFVGINNGGHGPSVYPGRIGGAPVTWNAGGFAALDEYTGKTVWQIPASAKDLFFTQYEANVPAPVTFSNNLLFGGDTGGYLYAIDAHTGYTYWSFYTGSTVESAPAVYNNTLYWGVGYPNFVAGHTLYAFGL